MGDCSGYFLNLITQSLKIQCVEFFLDLDSDEQNIKILFETIDI